MPLNAQIMLSILAHETSAGDLSRTLRATPASYALSLTDGTGANQAQIVWSDSRIAPANDEDGTGLASFTEDGMNYSFTSVKVIYIRNTGTVELLWAGGEWPTGPNPVAGAAIKIRPGGVVFMAAPDATGWATANSALRIDNQTATNGSYEVVLIGEGTIT
jgi:hypothetical protein